jgi:hypothetical protein
VTRVSRLVPWLVLAAAIMTALFPAGLMPKWGGPCGKALCECAPVVAAPDCENCSQRRSVAPQWTFSGNESCQPLSNTVAFHVAFTSLEAPVTIQHVNADFDSDVRPLHDAFALRPFVSAPSVRPPRS